MPNTTKPEDAATTLLEHWRWGTTPICPHCRSERTDRIPRGKPMPHRCRDCRRHFSVKTGTIMHGSKLPLTAWLIGSWYVQQGCTSVQLADELGIGIKTAWMLVRRLKAAAAHGGGLIADNPNPDVPYLRPPSTRRSDDQPWHDHQRQQLGGEINAIQKAQRATLMHERLRLFSRVAFNEQEKARMKELFAAERHALEAGEDRAGLIAERDAITAVAARRGPRQPSPEAIAFAKGLGQQAKEKRRPSDRRDPERGVRRSGML